MEKKSLTDEQKLKLRKLYSKVALDALLGGLKNGTLSFISTIFVFIVNMIFVKNQGFMFCGVLISTFMIIRSFRISSLKKHDIFKEEEKKILES